MATGLLVLVLGSYTKRAAEFSKLDKTYEAELTLGATSTTGDSEGEITAHSGKRKAKREELERLLHSLTGEISQTPPQFSAVKLGGQRAYSLARRGKEVKLEPRQVTVYELRVMSYEYPKLQIKTRVSSGTYIRSLAADIGQALGTGAYLSALRRTSVGEFDIKKALNLDELSLTSLKTNLIR